MNNIMLGYSNQINSSTLGTTAGTWNSSFPQSNLKNRLLSKAAITTTTSVTMTFTATAARCVGVIKTNLPVGATYSLSGGTYNSGTLTTTVANQDLMFGFATAQTGTFTLTITSSAVISIGRLFIGTALQPKVNMSVGAGLGYVSRTKVDESLGGVEYFKTMPVRRSFNFALDYLTDAEAYGIVMSILKNDISSEVLLLADYTDTTYGSQRNFMGRLSDLSPIKYPFQNMQQAAFNILEIV